jgi:murein DD-endopeptidase MepM/ murein hydrolase activator NlpD
VGALAAVLVGVILVASNRPPAHTGQGSAESAPTLELPVRGIEPTVEFVSSIDGRVVATTQAQHAVEGSTETTSAMATAPSDTVSHGGQVHIPAAPRVLTKADPGQSLAAWFRGIGVSDDDHLELLEAGPAANLALEPAPGDEVRVTISPEGKIQSYQLIGEGGVRWSLIRADSGFSVRTQPKSPRALRRSLVGAQAATGRSPAAPPVAAMATKPSIEPAASTSKRSIATVVRKGDSLYAKFREVGLRDAELARLLKSKGDTRALKRIRPGQKLRFYLTDQNRLDRLEIDISPVKFIRFSHTSRGYRSETVQRQFERRQVARRVVIERSLFEATSKASIPEPVAAQLTEIFGWDIDFLQDLRSGDALSVVYEEHYLEGKYFRAGPVLSAEVVNRGKPIRAVRYVDGSERAGYYTPKGRPLKRAFLRTPVRFSRISSRFNLARRHPILHKLRAHRGVDYAAPTGTPIKATGDGRVEFAGRKGGYGKTVVIRHGGHYKTLYAHMSRYARGIKRGRPVRQGEVIGYVGRTGLATGPHLHYEFQVAGKFRDPLKVKLPRARRLTGKEWKRFQKETRDMLARLESISATQFALARS